MKNTKRRVSILLTALMFLTLTVLSCSKADSNAMDGKMDNKTRVLLLGASVGRAWDISGMSSRKDTGDMEFEMVAVYQFDKTEALDEILMRPKRKPRMNLKYLKGFLRPSPKKPDIIILKECAAYFPGDLQSYKALVRGWVKKIRDNRIKVMLATVVPVTKEKALKREGQIDTILEYNDWVRDFAGKEGITVLDLEAALRVSRDDRYLQEGLADEDGLHLDRKAYDILDGVLLSTCNLPGKI